MGGSLRFASGSAAEETQAYLCNSAFGLHYQGTGNKWCRNPSPEREQRVRVGTAFSSFKLGKAESDVGA